MPKPSRNRPYRRPTGRKDFAPQTKTEGVAQPKVTAVKDAAYLASLRKMYCAVPLCANRDIHAHHMKTRGSGGGDDMAIPLCAAHHAEWHSLGESAFDKKYNVNLAEGARLLYRQWTHNNGAK